MCVSLLCQREMSSEAKQVRGKVSGGTGVWTKEEGTAERGGTHKRRVESGRAERACERVWKEEGRTGERRLASVGRTRWDGRSRVGWG